MKDMEIFRFNIKPAAEIERDQIRKAFNCCPMCESDLIFKHQKDEFTDSTLEVARCPSCEIKIRSESFPLQ